MSRFAGGIRKSTYALLAFARLAPDATPCQLGLISAFFSTMRTYSSAFSAEVAEFAMVVQFEST